MKTPDMGAYVAELMALDKTTLPADGGDRFNRLIFAKSPYLLQHAENPVQWYEWGDEPFRAAVERNVPVLLSIGYATCHWCHVMAHESFEDHEVAALLNQQFVCIKVDREERPDIDDFHMTVSQLMTGSGGWPLNVFLTPDRRPFFAMTYLPKQPRQGMGGLMELLTNIAALWRHKPESIENNCRSIMTALGDLAARSTAAETSALVTLTRQAYDRLSSIFDQQHGGFGDHPKFPMPINLSWLAGLPVADFPHARTMALFTLRRMRSGGIWDQLGGGLHRYTVDRAWLVPHFEKMLYDQAMVAWAALDLHQATREPFCLEVVRDISRFVERELTAPEGAFYSALDADSEGEEGAYYLWAFPEVQELLGDDAETICRCLGITAEGNFEGRTILTRAVVAPDDIVLERGRARLLARREQRIRPLTDKKIITAWNGLMIAALARAGIVCHEPASIERAARAACFILDRLRRDDGRLLRSFLATPSNTPAFLEDYAGLCHGLLELYESTLDNAWLAHAFDLADQALRLFRQASGAFAKTGTDAEQMLLPAGLDHDGVLPSPYSLMARCCLRLARYHDRPDLIEAARGLLAPCLADAGHNPSAQLGALQTMALLEHEPVTAEITGSRDDLHLIELLATLKTAHLPGLVISHTDAPVVAVSLCARHRCHPPVASVGALEKLLVELSGPEV